MRKIINSINERLYRETKRLMMHWGFGETCSSIYALLFISEKSITAEEIADELGYAYSSMINELNKLRREGVITRERKGRKYAYAAIKSVDSILLKEKQKTLSILKMMSEQMKKHRDMLEEKAWESVERSIDIIKGGFENERKE